MILAHDIDDRLEEKPAKLSLNSVQVLAHRLHECFAPVCELCILYVLSLVDPVEHLELHLHLLLNAQQLVRQVFLPVAHVLADDDEFVVIREHRLRQIRFVELHLYSVNFLLEIASFCRTWHEQGELGLLDHLDGFVEILGRPGLLVEENQGAAVFHVNTANWVKTVHVPHRDEILNLVLVNLRIENLQRISSCNLAQTLVFSNTRQFNINKADFMEDNHELRIRTE